jgi:hypothetical protein
MPAPAPSNDYESHALKKIRAKEDLKALTAVDEKNAREEVRKLEQSKRAALRAEIEGYRTDVAPDAIEAAEEKILSSIEQEISTQDAHDKEKANLVVESKSAAEKKLSPMQKMSESIMGPIKGIMKSLIAILPLSMIKSMVEKNPGGMFSRMAGDILKEKSLYGKMSEIFGPENMEKTSDDGKFIKELTRQYNVLPKPAEGKKMTFEEFYTAKMKAVESGGTPPYSLFDVKTVRIDEQEVQQKSEEVAEEKNEEERKQRSMQERMDSNPKVKNAVNVYALANTILEFSGEGFGVDPAAKEEDLHTRENSDTFHYEGVAERIATWLNEGHGHSTLGVELANDGDLEETDGGNWLYDADIISNFRQNLESYPPAAVQSLLDLDVNAVSMNDTATRTLPRFQDVLKNELAKLSGGSVDAPPETSEDA